MICCGIGGKISAAEDEHALPEHTSISSVAGRKVMVSVPEDYAMRAAKREMLDTLYVLDCESQSWFSRTVRAHRTAYAETRFKEGRNWYPELVVIGIQSPKEEDAAGLADFLRSELIPHVERQVLVKPYAAGRAACGFRGSGADAVRHMLLGEEEGVKPFRFFLIGNAGDARPPLQGEAGASSQTAYPDKTAIYLAAGAKEDPATSTALQQRVQQRVTDAAADITMFVNREGTQTYSHKERGGPPPVELEVVPNDDGDAAFAIAAVSWLGRRLEVQKHAQLGTVRAPMTLQLTLKSMTPVTVPVPVLDSMCYSCCHGTSSSEMT